MPVGAGGTGKAESRAKAKAPRQHAEEHRPGAAGHCRKAREADPEKGIRECAAEPGTSGKAPSDWAIRHGRTGKAAQARTDEQKEPGGAGRRIREPGSENEFPRKAAAFFARSL